MKVISWNCNGALRKKFHLLETFCADLIIIQECEDPKQIGGEYLSWASNFLWKADKKRGIGIFAKNNTRIELLPWEDQGLRLFLPCLVNDSFFLVAVWTKHASTFRYIGQMWRYLQVHREKIIQRPCAIVGDFNSNVFWDKKHRCWNHSDVVRELNAIEISSLYHGCSNEPQGTESAPTFYLHRDLKKPYHIDYAFVSESIKSNRPNFYVGSAEDWLKHSDHMPIVFSLSLSESVSNEQRIKSLPQRRKSAS